VFVRFFVREGPRDDYDEADEVILLLFPSGIDSSMSSLNDGLRFLSLFLRASLYRSS
jgi:hypothetical protein